MGPAGKGMAKGKMPTKSIKKEAPFTKNDKMDKLKKPKKK